MIIDYEKTYMKTLFGKYGTLYKKRAVYYMKEIAILIRRESLVANKIIYRKHLYLLLRVVAHYTII